MRESTIEAYLRHSVIRLGGTAPKLAPTVAGLPDRLVLLPGGRMYLVELKSPTGVLRPAQRVWHARAAELGTQVHVLRSKQDVDSFLSEVAPPPPR